MRDRILGKSLLATAVVVSVVVSGAVVSPPAASATVEEPALGGCFDIAQPEDNHASIRLDQPPDGTEYAVDEQGEITVSGILHKHATMLEVSDGQAVSSEFTFGPPPEPVSDWAVSWTTSLRPTHLGANELCAYAEREPKRYGKVVRSVTIVDLIPPSDVPDLAVSDVTSSTATVTWGAATDNYGLAGYEVTVDGGAPQRTTVGTRSHTITGLEPTSSHTVSVVAIDLAGNTSTTPATVSFTTDEAPPPPDGNLAIDPGQGVAEATWEPDLPTELTYRTFLDGELYDEFPPDHYCEDADGTPVSPCPPDGLIRYLFESLEEGTPYTLRVDALDADGTVVRSFSGSFTTTTGEPLVPPGSTQLAASEASRCAGMGGDLYVEADVRGSVPIPAGSTQVFEGCYMVADSGCLDDFLPPSGDVLIECTDDLTDLLFALAPPGRGPVISSLEAFDPGTPTKIEPLEWCTSDPEACTLVLSRSAQAVRLLAAAVSAIATTSFLVVVAGGIGLGVALGVLLPILFPTELGISGLLEYTAITFDTDFDTFDEWGLNEGLWYNNLKMYAQVVQTTRQLASRHNLPFAWNDLADGSLRVNIDVACRVQTGVPSFSGACETDFAVYVPGGQNYRFRPMQETGDHIVAALGGQSIPTPERLPWLYPAYSKGGAAATAVGYTHGWYRTPQFTPNECTPPEAGKICDEFPFWSTNQAVDLSGERASLELVPSAEQRPQATDLRQFYSQCQVNDADRFMVLPVPAWVAAGGPSFGFRVSDGGASLCLEPSPGT